MKCISTLVLLVCSFGAIAATPAFAAGSIGPACYAAGFTQKAAHGQVSLSQQISWCVTQKGHIIDFAGSATTKATNGWLVVRKWHTLQYTMAGPVGHRYVSEIVRTSYAKFAKHTSTVDYTATLFVTQSTF